MKKVFVDGSYGTVGLLIAAMLKKHPGIEMLEIPFADRKDIDQRERLISQADLVVLCLPSKSVESTIMTVPTTVKLIDCSTLYRCNDDWVYGLPELTPGHRNKIQQSYRVANAGCFATAFILGTRPLLNKKIISSHSVVTAFALTGFSAGGKRMISLHQAQEIQAQFHSLDMNHKHLPEMKKHTGLEAEPLFIPAVGSHEEGLMLTLPLQATVSREELMLSFVEAYHAEKHITLHATSPNALSPVYPSTNTIDLYVGGAPGRYSVTVRLNNLMKGAAGNALQCINLMLGLDEWLGLN